MMDLGNYGLGDQNNQDVLVGMNLSLDLGQDQIFGRVVVHHREIVVAEDIDSVARCGLDLPVAEYDDESFAEGRLVTER